MSTRQKNILLTSVLFVILSLNLSAKAMPIASVDPVDDSTAVIATSQLSKFEVAPELQISPTEGVLIIKHQDIVIKLVESPVDCTLVACAVNAERELLIEVPLVNVAKNECGVIEYVGYKNVLSTNGARTAIVVTDYTHNSCPLISGQMALADVKIELSMEHFNHVDGTNVKAESKFDGQSLEAVNTVF